MSSVAFSVISAIIAVVALIQTQSQIKLSNKHQLFERRLNNFFVFYGLYELYNENRVIFGETRKDNPLFDVDVNFLWLTNNSYLEVCMEAMQRPNSSLARKEFLTKREELKKLAMESRLIFPRELGEKMALFICEYEKLLQIMYGYKLLLNEMDKQIDRMDLAQSIKCFGEEDGRSDLLMAYAALKDAFEGLEKDRIVERVENLIKLEP